MIIDSSPFEKRLELTTNYPGWAGYSRIGYIFLDDFFCERCIRQDLIKASTPVYPGEGDFDYFTCKKCAKVLSAKPEDNSRKEMEKVHPNIVGYEYEANLYVCVDCNYLENKIPIFKSDLPHREKMFCVVCEKQFIDKKPAATHKR